MDKKEKILTVALALFSSQGFDSTSTSLIAKQAEVSEGLIFRHFTNKEGLLMALMEKGIEKIQPFFSTILSEKKPKKIIKKVIELPYQIIAAEKDFWRLQINLKAKNAKFKADFKENDYLIPIYLKVQDAFKELEFPDAILETQYLFTVLNGLTLSLIELENLSEGLVLVEYIQSKYKK
jgi:AcrR family transcriptional regulator